MRTEWIEAQPDKAPILYYLTYTSKLGVYKGHELSHFVPTSEQLPYTASMLSRRLEYGRDVPKAWRAQVFEITVSKEAA